MMIKELEETYHDLHGQLLQGELDDEAFKMQVEKLRFKDDQGRQWKIGWYTGKWYRYDQGQWIQDQPPEQPPSGGSSPEADTTAAPQRSRRRPLATWLVPVLVGLLVVAAVLLIWGWSSGWWRDTASDATPTAIAQAEPTLTPTTTPTQPSPTMAHTANPVPSPTPSATTRPTQAPTETPLPTVTETVPPTPTEGTDPTALPSPAPAFSGRIYYPVFDPERRTFDIYAYQLGSGRRQLIVEEASQPALSPDGERLAYRSWARNFRNIRVIELDDGETWTWVNHAEAARPSWSPDSQNVVFPSQQEPDRQWRLYHTLGLEFDRVRRHGGDIFGRVPNWMADGRIVYWECPLDKCGLYAMQSDGTSPVRLTNHEHDTAPAAAPDGSQVAFMSNQDGNWEIYRTGTQGLQEPQRLTRNPARDGLPTWSPDGQWLAFVSDRQGSWAVWAMRPDGSDLQKLFALDGSLEGEISRVLAQDQHGWTWEHIAWGP